MIFNAKEISVRRIDKDTYVINGYDQKYGLLFVDHKYKIKSPGYICDSNGNEMEKFTDEEVAIRLATNDFHSREMNANYEKRKKREREERIKKLHFRDDKAKFHIVLLEECNMIFIQTDLDFVKKACRIHDGYTYIASFEDQLEAYSFMKKNYSEWDDSEYNQDEYCSSVYAAYKKGDQHS